MELSCSKCKTIKSESEFHKLTNRNPGRNNRASECKDCAKIVNQKYIDNNRKEYLRKHKIRSRFNKTGFTPELFNQRLEEQGGICAICGTDKPGGQGDWQADHCHNTKIPRGLLCWHCNVALGLMKDNPERLRNAAAYLEQYNAALGLSADEIAALSK